MTACARAVQQQQAQFWKQRLAKESSPPPQLTRRTAPPFLASEWTESLVFSSMASSLSRHSNSCSVDTVFRRHARPSSVMSPRCTGDKANFTTAPILQSPGSIKSQTIWSPRHGSLRQQRSHSSAVSDYKSKLGVAGQDIRPPHATFAPNGAPHRPRPTRGEPCHFEYSTPTKKYRVASCEVCSKSGRRTSASFGRKGEHRARFCGVCAAREPHGSTVRVITCSVCSAFVGEVPSHLPIHLCPTVCGLEVCAAAAT